MKSRGLRTFSLQLRTLKSLNVEKIKPSNFKILVEKMSYIDCQTTIASRISDIDECNRSFQKNIFLKNSCTKVYKFLKKIVTSIILLCKLYFYFLFSQYMI